LAKACHPDLGGGRDGAAFLRLRTEYEEALRYQGEALANRGKGRDGGSPPGRTEAKRATKTGTGGRGKAGRTGPARGARAAYSGASAHAGGSPRRSECRAEAAQKGGESRIERPDFYADFCNLVASGFPADSLVKAESRGYRNLRARTIRGFSCIVPGGEELFLDLERELERLYSNAILDQLAGKVRMFVYNICSYHRNPSAFQLNAIRRWALELKPILAQRRLPAVGRVLACLVDDLELGPALAD